MIAFVGESLTGSGGLMRYLAGPGHGNEHENQRVVAGSVRYPGKLDAAMATQMSHDLEMPNGMHPSVVVKGGHIWQVTLAIGADEGRLSDNAWEAIAEDYMAEMGFIDPAKAAVRWTAVNHGLSVEGNDHIHIVMNRVREDGTKVNTFKDMPRSQTVAAKLEQKHGLKVLQSRHSTQGASSVPYTAGEAARAAKTGQPIERLELERRVRGHAVAATTEAEFVRRMRGDGLLVRPYPAAGEVTGYSVGLPAPVDQKQVFFQGGKLARDLTLPRLRGTWPNGGGSAAAATAEWRQGAPGKPVVKTGRETKPVATTPQAVTAVQAELTELGERLTAGDPVEFAAASHDLAGVLSAGSRAIEGSRIGPVGKAARDTGAWAQTRKAPPKTVRRKAVGRGSALLLMQALDPTGDMGQMVMYRQLIDTAMALYRLHRANRPVVGVKGRSPKVAENDGIDDSMEGMGTVGLTLAARAVQVHAEERRIKKEEENDLRLRESEKEGMSDEQRAQALPEPGALDYRAWDDGANLDATDVQVGRIQALSSATGEFDLIADAYDMTRAQASAKLLEMEAKLGADKVAETYAAQGIDTSEHTPPRVNQPPQGGNPLNNPLLWKDAGAQVTEAQRYTLKQAGLSGTEIGQLDKGHASLVISAIGEGPAKMREVYEQNTLGARIMDDKKRKPPVVQQPRGKPVGRIR
jgi:hypothetical protein